jgi:nucleotide-binding universal stress UspA family protein
MIPRRILVPTDLSKEGDRALPALAELAPRLGAEIVLLHVIENPLVRPLRAGAARTGYVAASPEQVEDVRPELEERVRGFPADVQVRAEVVTGPDVPAAIHGFAAAEGCDTIALSSHGRTGFRRFVLGSVAEEVLRGARVPVLVFPRQE